MKSTYLRAYLLIWPLVSIEIQYKLAKSAAYKAKSTKARYLNVKIHYSLAKSAAWKANSTKRQSKVTPRSVADLATLICCPFT